MMAKLWITVGDLTREMTDAEQKTHEAIISSDKMPLHKDDAYAREDRQNLLEKSDWTQAADTPLTSTQKTAWATYRQALRDLPTADEKWPNSEEITWPTQPE